MCKCAVRILALEEFGRLAPGFRLSVVFVCLFVSYSPQTLTDWVSAIGHVRLVPTVYYLQRIRRAGPQLETSNQNASKFSFYVAHGGHGPGSP